MSVESTLDELGQRTRSLGPAQAWRWYRLGEPLLVFAVSRLGFLLLASLGQFLISRMVDTGSFAGDSFLQMWSRWDSIWYLGIADKGYDMDLDPLDGQQSNAFFPFFPLLVRLFSLFIGDPIVAGLTVANLSFAGGLIVLYALVDDQLGRNVARWTVLLLSFSPFSYFFMALYTESTFLFLVVLSFWLAEKGHWWLSGLAGMLSALTRLVGASLCPALLLIYLQRRGWRWRNSGREVLAPLLVPLGTAGYALFLYLRFGDPLAFYNSATTAWSRYSVFVQGLGPLNPLAMTEGNDNLVLALNLLVAALCLLAALPTAQKLGWGYAAFIVIGVLVPFSAGLHSLGRYVTVLFPAFVVLAYYLRGRLIAELTLITFAMLLGLLTLLFINWYSVI